MNFHVAFLVTTVVFKITNFSIIFKLIFILISIIIISIIVQFHISLFLSSRLLAFFSSVNLLGTLQQAGGIPGASPVIHVLCITITINIIIIIHSISFHSFMHFCSIISLLNLISNFNFIFECLKQNCPTAFLNDNFYREILFGIATHLTR